MLAARGREAPARLVLIPLESRASRAIVLLLTLALAALLANTIVRPAVAWHLAARAKTPADLERALAWDPRHPALHLRLGHAYADAQTPDLSRARAHFETARRLRPTDSLPWLHLARLAQRQGDARVAREAIDQALRLDPHSVSVRWEAAVQAFRTGDRERALEHFRYVLAVDPSQRDAAFQLARTLLKPGENAATLLPDERDGLTNVLVAALGSRDLDLAQAAWTRRVSLAPAVDEKIVRRYLDLLLEAGDGATARRVWLDIIPDGHPDARRNAVWNGGFETERLLGWGLDWRVRRQWGVEVDLDRFVAARGTRSLRLTFNSFPTLDFAGVSQLLAVEPGRQYRLTVAVKAQDFTTRSGLKLQILDPTIEAVLAETEPVAGTTADWVSLETTVRIPKGTSLALLRLRREPAPGPEGNLGGKVWLDEVRLE